MIARALCGHGRLPAPTFALLLLWPFWLRFSGGAASTSGAIVRTVTTHARALSSPSYLCLGSLPSLVLHLPDETYFTPLDERSEGGGAVKGGRDYTVMLATARGRRGER